MVDPTDIEKKSLEAHVELCAERYRALETQFENVKQDICDVKRVVTEVHGLVNNMSQQRNNQLYNWGVAIIGGLLAIVGWLLVTYVFK